MRNIFSFFGLFVVFSFCLLASGANKAEGANTASVSAPGSAENLQGQTPLMEFKNFRVNLGDVYRGQKVSGEFEFTNKGNGTLQVRGIHAACGCLNVKINPDMQFKPGASGKITFDFDSSNFAGSVVRPITVDTNMPSPNTITLTVSAHVKQEISATPALVFLGEVEKDFSKSVPITLIYGKQAPGKDSENASVEKTSLSADLKKLIKDSSGDFSALAVTTSSPHVFASLKNVGSKPQVIVEFKGNLPIGPFRERVSVWNNSKHLKELVIPLAGEVIGHVKPSAKYIEFGVVTKPSQVRRTLTLNSDLKNFEVLSVEVETQKTGSLTSLNPSNIISYQTVKTKPGNVAINFDLKYPANFKPEKKIVNTTGAFIVKTNDQDYKEIRIPFFGVLRDSK